MNTNLNPTDLKACDELVSSDTIKLLKIKAINPMIIVEFINMRGEERPYYSIFYIDATDHKPRIKYSSFDLSFVRRMLRTHIDPISMTVKPIKTSRWLNCKCDNCGHIDPEYPRFCSNCGAEMLIGDHVNILNSIKEENRNDK